MAMLHEEGKMQMCPYNTAHMIREKRMQTHLVKCRKNYPTQDFVVCPMDSRHHVPRTEFSYHVENCPKRSVVDQALVKPHSSEPIDIAPPPPKSLVDAVTATEEVWNDDYPSYDPLANAASRNVVRKLTNAPRAEKREFQEAERLRLIRLQEEMEAQGPLEELSQLENDPEDKPVRMPKSQSKAFSTAHP